MDTFESFYKVRIYWLTINSQVTSSSLARAQGQRWRSFAVAVFMDEAYDE
jgi:hypothetical protein